MLKIKKKLKKKLFSYKKIILKYFKWKSFIYKSLNSFRYPLNLGQVVSLNSGWQ
jgi:hypothetical protein